MFNLIGLAVLQSALLAIGQVLLKFGLAGCFHLIGVLHFGVLCFGIGNLHSVAFALD